MSRYLRYLLIWLSCTAVSVTAVLVTVHFVVGSTRPTPPVAQSAPTVFTSPPATSRPRPSTSASRTPRPSPPPSRPIAHDSGTIRIPAPAGSGPADTGASPTPPGAGGTNNCVQGGTGVHTIQSQGGQASVRFGDAGVCLVSAVPERGFTVRTVQSDPATLTVTFYGDRHESDITASTTPQDSATVREASW